MTYVKASNGDVVPTGTIQDESWVGRLWRAPRMILPKSVAENPSLSLLVMVLPGGVWALVLWWIWRKARRA